MRFFSITTILLSQSVLLAAIPESAALFDSKIAPLLARHCLECHDTTTRKGKLDLSKQQTALKGGTDGPAIVPGHPERSLLWQSIESGEMPEDRPPLTNEEKADLKQWIASGAVWTAPEIDPSAIHRSVQATIPWVRRLTRHEYIATVRATTGVDITTEALRLLPPDTRADGFANTAYNLTVDLGHIEAYSRLASLIASRIDLKPQLTAFSHDKTTPPESLPRLIRQFARPLLRGPLEASELASYQKLATALQASGADLTTTTRGLIQAMLQSPRFLYRIENNSTESQQSNLTPHQLATRLSYLVLGAPPDEALLAAADRNELTTPQQIISHVQRLIGDPRARDQARLFMSEWLNLDRLNDIQPDPKRFPKWKTELAQDMRSETLMLFDNIVWQEKRPLQHLLTATHSYLTPRLARHYNLPQPATPSNVPQLVQGKSSPALNTKQRITDGLAAWYRFDEANGTRIRNHSPDADPTSDLHIKNPKAVRFSADGLVVEDPTLISTDKPPTTLIKKLQETGALTLEAWITPANDTQDGPARVLTLSDNTNRRNFTLGQNADHWEARLRTTASGNNGYTALSSATATAAPKPTHIAYTRTREGKTLLYINGQPGSPQNAMGDLSNWQTDFRLRLANEGTEDRPWRGTLHQVAIYHRTLSAGEITRNLNAGARPNQAGTLLATPPKVAPREELEPPNENPERITPGLVAWYRFDEGSGNIIHDLSPTGSHLQITDPSTVKWDRNGLTLLKPSLISSDAPPTSLIAALKKSQTITIEAWVTPASTKQAGPARIITFSKDTGARNLMLGQENDRWQVRLRTSKTTLNGQPEITSSATTVSTSPTHIVYIRDAVGKARLYINGKARGESATLGDHSNWDENFRLILGNEGTKDRPWLGTLHQVALYDRALIPEDILQNHAAGPRGEARFEDNTKPVRVDLTAIPTRRGILTHGSVLTLGGDDASMVARGLFVLHHVLHSAVGSAPAGVDTTPVPVKPGQSHRHVAEQRLSETACTACHTKFEPLAFAFEKFDGLGAWHETDEHQNRLREDGQFVIPGQPDPFTYQSTAEFIDQLASSDRVAKNFVRKLAQFALGRPLVESDLPHIDQIHQAAPKNGHTYQSLITALAQSPLLTQ